MTDEHEEALAAFLQVFDERLNAGPLIERRTAPRDRDRVIEARRTQGPTAGDAVYWVRAADRR